MGELRRGKLNRDLLLLLLLAKALQRLLLSEDIEEGSSSPG